MRKQISRLAESERACERKREKGAGMTSCPANKKREPKLSLSDQTDKPGSVVCGNLSTLTVADKLKPSLLYIRRADVKI